MMTKDERTKLTDTVKGHAKECGIPQYMIPGLLRYIIDGIKPGGFLTAVITNDLRGAFNQADATNIKIIRHYLEFFYMYAPSSCWGSEDDFKSWQGVK